MTTMHQKGGGVMEKLVPVLVLVSVVLAFAVGFMWQKVSLLEKGGVGNAIVPTDQPQEPTNGKLSETQISNVPQITDDDHILGSNSISSSLLRARRTASAIIA